MKDRGRWGGADKKLVEFEVIGVSGGQRILVGEGRVCGMWKEKNLLTWLGTSGWSRGSVSGAERFPWSPKQLFVCPGTWGPQEVAGNLSVTQKV